MKYISIVLLASVCLLMSQCGRGMKQVVSADLQVDHINIWVKDPQRAKEKLMNIGFSSVPDSLSAIHHGQGTSGRYFHFLNMYLELIFVYDQDELEANYMKNKDLDFTKRADFESNGASPFSVALKVKDYNTDKIPFEKVRYHQDWMEENSSIYSAKNSKNNLMEPSIFVVYPTIAYKPFERMSDLDTISEEYAFVRDFYRHSNKAEKLTKIVITSTDVDLTTTTMQAINGVNDIVMQNGEEHLMELFFDNSIQNIRIDLRPELPLIVNL